MNDKILVESRAQDDEKVNYTLSYINSENQTAASLAGLVKYINTNLTNDQVLNIIWRRDTDITSAA